MHPLLEGAYHKLGYPDRSFDQVAAKRAAADHRRAGSREDAPAGPQGSELRLRDQKLEALGPVEKLLLLRMGRRTISKSQGPADRVRRSDHRHRQAH